MCVWGGGGEGGGSVHVNVRGKPLFQAQKKREKTAL